MVFSVPTETKLNDVVLKNVRIGEAMQVAVHQRQTHYVGRYLIPLEVFGEAGLVVGPERAVALGVSSSAQGVLVSGDEKPAVPQAESRLVSFFCGATTSTMKSMMWRGVRNWSASP